MKTYFFLLLFFFCTTINAQIERYIYRTEINPDTINLVNMKVENTFLEVKEGKSIFISEQKVLRDSLSNVVKSTEEVSNTKKNKKSKQEFPKLANGKSLQPTLFEFFVTKDMDRKTVNLVENIGSKQIYYTEDRSINWEITNDFSTHNDYKVQRATLDFGGRKWNAWFTEEIKLKDGPYKFYGLPGLIVKLEDEKGDYRFSLINKITLDKAFSGIINSDAKASTRIDFLGDKAAVILENKSNKNFDDIDPLYFYQQKGNPQGMGNPNTGDGFGDNKFSNQNNRNTRASISGWKSPNPIELKNK